MSQHEPNRYDELSDEDQEKMRREMGRIRRATVARRRSRKSVPNPGGIRQRRNKHWHW